jgi:hypothetical protein
MDTQKLLIVLIQLALFSVFVTSIIEVVKGISAMGIFGLVRSLWNTLIVNKPMPKDSFPVLNFLISLLCCYKFNVGIMTVFAASLGAKNLADSGTEFLNYFGTAAIIYMGSDQMFKKFIDVEKKADSLVTETNTLFKATKVTDNAAN